MPAWTARPDGIAIAVRVTPRSAKEALAAGTEEHFAARVNAPPVEGAANDAVVRLVARTFGVPRGAVTLIGGETARIKRLHVAGDPAALAGIAASL